MNCEHCGVDVRYPHKGGCPENPYPFICTYCWFSSCSEGMGFNSCRTEKCDCECNVDD